MTNRLILTTISLLIILSSCCKLRRGEGSLPPEWETRIPTGSSKAIFYDGLKTLPKYKDVIIAHTTIYDGGFNFEDNRLCAVNLKTGLVEWHFPENLEERHYCDFDAKSYLYKNKLVFQYQKDARTYDSRDFITTVCIDLDTRETLWEKTATTKYRFCSDAIGIDGICYFLSGDNELHCADLIEDKISVLLKLPGEYLHRVFHTSDGRLLLFSFQRLPVPPDGYYYINKVRVLDRRTGEVKYIRPVLPPEGSWSRRMRASGFEKDGVIYCDIDTYLTAIDIKSDSPLWERDDNWAYSAKYIHEHSGVLLKCGGNATTGYDAKTGAVLYNYDNYGSDYSIQEGKYAYMLTRKQNVDIINIETGEILDVVKCKYASNGEYFSGSCPTIHDGKMYIMSYRHLFRYPVYPW